MKNILLITLFFLFSKLITAQNIFNEAIGGPLQDEALFTNTTSDGGYIIVGWTTSFGAGNWDLYLVKTNAQGAISWTKTYGGLQDEVDCSVVQTTDGGYIIASRTSSFGSGDADVFLVKTDSTGMLQWSKTYGGTGWEEGHSILQSDDGGYIHTGYTESFGAGGQDIYLIKNDNIGEVEWTKTFGGAGDERGHKIKQTVDGGYLIAGETTSFGSGGWDFYLIKTDPDGNLQ